MNTLKKQQFGFTLIELMVVVAVAAILISMAVPSFQGYIKKNAVQAHQHQIAGALVLARGEALDRNKYISICPSSNGESCSGSWSDGWLVFVDDGEGSGTRGDGVLNGAEEIINANLYTGTNTLSITDPNATSLKALSYDHRGRSFKHTTGGSESSRIIATICEKDANVEFSRGLMVESSGRVMRTRPNASGVHEGVYEDDGGSLERKALSCP